MRQIEIARRADNCWPSHHSRTSFMHYDTLKERALVYFADSSLASMVICALSTLETGHDFSAIPANSLNFASSRFGTPARSVSAERVMRKPWPSGSRLTAASVVNSVGV